LEIFGPKLLYIVVNMKSLSLAFVTVGLAVLQYVVAGPAPEITAPPSPRVVAELMKRQATSSYGQDTCGYASGDISELFYDSKPRRKLINFR